MNPSDPPPAGSAKLTSSLLAARPRLDTRRHSDSMVGASSNPIYRSVAGGTGCRANASRSSATSGDDNTSGPSPSAPSPPCPTPPAADGEAMPVVRTHSFYTRVPTNPSDLRSIQWQLTPNRLTCLSSTGELVVAFELHELVWRPDGIYGIEFGLDSRFLVSGGGDNPALEMQVVEAADVGSSESSLSTGESTTSSLGTIASETEHQTGGHGTLSQELLAALQQEATLQQQNYGSTTTVIVHISDEEGNTRSATALESTESFFQERAHAGLTSRPGTAVDARTTVPVPGARTAATDTEQELADKLGYVEGFRIYSENAMEVTNWLNILNAFRASHPLIPRITYSSTDLVEDQLIDSYESVAPPANTRRNSAAIGNPDALMATVARQLENNATPAAIRVTIIPTEQQRPALVDTPSLTPPGSIGSSSSLTGGGSAGTTTTSAKFIRILDAAQLGGPPVVVATGAVGRVTVKDQVTGKTVLDVRDSLEILHEKLGGTAVADSSESSLGSLQSVPSANKIPLACGSVVHVGYKVPLKGDAAIDAKDTEALATQGEHTVVGGEVDADNTLGNAQWKALKSGGEDAATSVDQQDPPKVIIGHPEPDADDHDEQEVLGDTLKGSGSAMRLKSAVVAATGQMMQDTVGLGRLGI